MPQAGMAARELDEDRGSDARRRERRERYARYERERSDAARSERPRLHEVAPPAAASPRADRATPAPAPPRTSRTAAPRDPAPTPRRSPDTALPERRTVTITGRGAERYRPAPQRRPARRAHERPGFRPDRIAMWAVLLCVLMILAATTSSHAATRPQLGKSLHITTLARSAAESAASSYITH